MKRSIPSNLMIPAILLSIIVGCGQQKPAGEQPDARPVPSEVTTVSDSRTAMISLGEQVYKKYCLACHQANGSGVPGMYPPLARNGNLQGDPGPLIQILLKGKSGTLVVNGQSYSGIMAPHAYLTDEEVAAVLTYIRASMGNAYPPVEPAAVAALR